MKSTKKLFALLMCVFLLFSSFLGSISVAADGAGMVKRRVLIMSAPYDVGPITQNNTLAIQNAFTKSNATIDGIGYKYMIYSYVNNQEGHSTTTFLNAITTYLENADSNDISYVYICSHGAPNGELGINGASNPDRLSLSALKQRLDTIQGKIVLMIDACYSGNAIANSRDTNSTNELTATEEKSNFAQMMVDEFLGERTRNGEFLGSQKYSVLCSCLSTEESYTFSLNSSDPLGPSILIASYAWARVLGYDFLTDTYSSSFPNDSSGDAVISPSELITATNNYLSSYARPGCTQHAAFYFPNNMTSVFYKNYMIGDVNLDKQITLADTLKLTQYLSGSTTLTGTALLLADTDQDGDIDLDDRQELQNYIAGIVTYIQ